MAQAQEEINVNENYTEELTEEEDIEIMEFEVKDSPICEKELTKVKLKQRNSWTNLYASFKRKINCRMCRNNG